MSTAVPLCDLGVKSFALSVHHSAAESAPSDQAGFYPAQKVFSIGLRLRQCFGLVTVFESNLLQKQFHRVFRLETLGHQFANARREAFMIRPAQPQ